MKNHKTLTIVCAIAVLIGIALFIGRQQHPKPQPQRPSRQHLPAPVALTPATPNKANAAAPEISNLSAGSAQTEVGPANLEAPLKLRSAQVVATVNGVQIAGKDLLPFPAAKANEEKTMSPDMFRFLRDLAIERELVFQTAQAQGVELSDEQKRQIEQVRKSLLAREQAEAGQVVHLNRMGSLDEEIAFELRDAASRLLESSLLAKAGAPPAFVTESAVQEYYRKHLDAFGHLPDDSAARSQAWQKIDLEIRQQLAPQVQAEYQQRVRKYLEQLRGNAKITTHAPIS